MSIINEQIKLSKIHLDRLKKATMEIKEYNILEYFDTDNFELVKIIDTFIFRYIKFQDYIGNKLFRTFLKEIREFQENMSFIDVLDKLEKLEIIENANKWIYIRKLRNKLTHEYPDEMEYIKEEIKEAIEYVKDFETLILKIEKYLQERNLI